MSGVKEGVIKAGTGPERRGCLRRLFSKELNTVWLWFCRKGSDVITLSSGSQHWWQYGKGSRTVGLDVQRLSLLSISV